MVLLVPRLGKLYTKLEKFHYHHHQKSDDALSASLQAFRSEVSSFINRFLLNSKPGFEILSFSWVQQCFELLPVINKAFAKLIVEIDYPVSRWKGESIEEYLRYSLELIDLLNSVSSSLSHLGQARLSLSHALSLVEKSPSSAIERLKPIELKSLNKDFKDLEYKGVQKERSSCLDEEWVIHEALVELKGIGLWVCFVVLAGLSGDTKAYLETRKSAGLLSNSSLINLDASISGVVTEKGCVLMEVKELNDAAAGLAASIATEKSRDAAEEMQRRLEVFEKLIDGLGKEVDRLFFELLAGRDELLNGIRHGKQ